jgi:hypothetical protein
MFRGVRDRARYLRKTVVRPLRVHVAIRLDPTSDRSHILGAFSTTDHAKREISRVDSISGWIQCPTNPFWISSPMSSGCFWEVLDLDVDWSLIDAELDTRPA